MGYDRIRIKNKAKDIIRQARPRPWGVTLLLWFLLADLAAIGLLPLMATGLFSVPAGGRPPLLPLLLGIALGVGLLLLALILHGGYTSYTLQLWRQERATGFAELLLGFFSASQILELWTRMLLHTLLWALPGVAVLACIRSLCTDPTLSAAWRMPMPSALTYPVAVVLFVLYMLERVSRYALAPLSLMDKPEAGAQQAIDRSKRLMAGRKLDLLVFLLSFLGWWLVAALVAGLFFLLGALLLALILGLAAQPAASPFTLLLPFLLFGLAAAMPLLLWLTSYMGTAFVGFYAAAAAPPFPGLQPPAYRRRDLL